jgi:Sulfotransferase family
LLPNGAWYHAEYERIYLCHVRKTAGTSIAFAFMRLSGTDPHLIERRLSRFAFAQSHGYRYVAHDETLIREGRYFFAFGHAPAYVASPPTSGTFKFTVLRDPIDRVVSLYRYLACPGADSPFSFTPPLAERQWAMEGFDRFLDLIPPEHLTNQLHMFSRSSSINQAVDCLSNFNMVLRHEQLNEGLDRLQRALNLNFSLGRDRASLLQFTPSDAQRDRLYDLLSVEYEILRQIDTSSRGVVLEDAWPTSDQDNYLRPCLNLGRRCLQHAG